MIAMSLIRKWFQQNCGLLGLFVALLSGCSSSHHVSILSHDDELVEETHYAVPPSSSVVNQPALPQADPDSSYPIISETPKPRSVDPPRGSSIAAQTADDSTLPRELEDVFFDYDQYSIRREMSSILEQNARVLLKRYPTREVLIEGHCDERGTEEYNLILGERRARVVKHYLVDLGVPASNLQVLSLGKTEPFCLQPTLQCFQRNRRAHMVLK